MHKRTQPRPKDFAALPTLGLQLEAALVGLTVVLQYLGILLADVVPLGPLFFNFISVPIAIPVQTVRSCSKKGGGRHETPSRVGRGADIPLIFGP